MHKISILITGFIFILSSCKKDKALIGEWRWINTAGGISGGIVAEPSADSVVTLTLNDNSTYIGYLNNQIKAEDGYSLLVAQNNDTIIRFDHPLQIGKFLLIGEKGFAQRGNKLYFSDYQISDGYTRMFERINKRKMN